MTFPGPSLETIPFMMRSLRRSRVLSSPKPHTCCSVSRFAFPPLRISMRTCSSGESSITVEGIAWASVSRSRECSIFPASAGCCQKVPVWRSQGKVEPESFPFQNRSCLACSIIDTYDQTVLGCDFLDIRSSQGVGEDFGTPP